MTFAASYDRFTKILSAIVCLGFFGVVLASHNIAVATLAIAVILVSFAYSPRGYILEGRSILVRRLAGQARVALDDIREVRRATADDSRGCIRLWGSGGLFGYYGLFSSTKLGRFTEYVTNRKNGVVVITASKTVLFSPDDIDGFLDALRAMAPVTASAPVPATTFDAKRRFRGLGTTIGITLAVAAMGLGLAANFYSPGPPAYTLTSAALTIHDRFYPVTLRPDAVDLSQIRIVDLEADPDWRPIARTNGFANSHYQSGWFRAGNGQKIRLYRAGGQRVVLLPPKDGGAAVLYQARAPDSFIADVHAAWSK
jgi:Bacterial PH domain